MLQTHLIALLMPFLVVLLSNLLGAFQWGWLVRKAGLRVSRGRLLGHYFIGLFFNNFGVGNLGGDVYKIYSLGRREAAVGQVAGATVLDRVVSAVALCAVGLGAAVIMLVRGSVPPRVALATVAVRPSLNR